MATNRDDPENLRQLPMSELVKQLADEVSLLVRQEIELARAEMTTKAKRAGIGLGELGSGGIAALYALGALTACFIAALALVMPVWASALIVAAVYAAIAAVLVVIGRRQLEEAGPPAPQRTQQTIKEDIEWARTQKPSSGR
jgi:Putative Actinobacterial Holin-X, holin superfamily III